MKLYDIIEHICKFSDTTARYVVFFSESRNEAAGCDVEIRFWYPEEKDTSSLTVEYRYYPDKHGQWSDWRHHDGFTAYDILADDWMIVLSSCETRLKIALE